MFVFFFSLKHRSSGGTTEYLEVSIPTKVRSLCQDLRKCKSSYLNQTDFTAEVAKQGISLKPRHQQCVSRKLVSLKNQF